VAAQAQAARMPAMPTRRPAGRQDLPARQGGAGEEHGPRPDGSMQLKGPIVIEPGTAARASRRWNARCASPRQGRARRLKMQFIW
jgi:hypothetical protein